MTPISFIPITVITFFASHSHTSTTWRWPINPFENSRKLFGLCELMTLAFVIDWKIRFDGGCNCGGVMSFERHHKLTNLIPISSIQYVKSMWLRSGICWTHCGTLDMHRIQWALRWRFFFSRARAKTLGRNCKHFLLTLIILLAEATWMNALAQSHTWAHCADSQSISAAHSLPSMSVCVRWIRMTFIFNPHKAD